MTHSQGGEEICASVEIATQIMGLFPVLNLKEAFLLMPGCFVFTLSQLGKTHSGLRRCVPTSTAYLFILNTQYQPALCLILIVIWIIMGISLLLYHRTSTTIISFNHEANHVGQKVTFQIYQNPLELLLEHSKYPSSSTYMSQFLQRQNFSLAL